MLQTLADHAVLASPLPLLTSPDARALGIRVPGPAFHRVRAGAYVDAAAWAGLMPWQRYQVRVHAFALLQPDAILCLESASVVLGLPLFGHPRDIHVYDPDRAASRRFGDVCVHTSADPRDVVEIGGIRVTSLRDTALDLARVLPAGQGVATLAAAVAPAQGGTTTRELIAARAREQQARRGAALLPEVLALADPLLESPYEAMSYGVIAWSGFEWPELQTTFRYEGHADRADFFFGSVGGIGESDGWGKYELGDPAGAAEAIRREKRREDRLRRNGHRLARWDAADVHRVAPICRALQAIGVPIHRAPKRALVASFRRASPRSLPPDTA